MDGLTMKKDFCEELVDKCSGQGNIVFPSYGGDSYCKKHTGGGSDLFWAYPYTERKCVFVVWVAELLRPPSRMLPGLFSG